MSSGTAGASLPPTRSGHTGCGCCGRRQSAHSCPQCSSHCSSLPSGWKRSPCRSATIPASARMRGNCFPRSRSVKNTRLTPPRVKHRALNLVARQIVVISERLDGLTGVNAICDGGRGNSDPARDGPSEGYMRVDRNWPLSHSLRRVDVGEYSLTGNCPLVPLDALEVVLEHLAHRQLAGGAEVDELHIAIQEYLTGVSSKLRDSAEGDATAASSLSRQWPCATRPAPPQIARSAAPAEHEPRSGCRRTPEGLGARRLDQRMERGESVPLGIGAPDQPGPQGRGGQAQVACGLCGVRTLAACGSPARLPSSG